jgi:hypothetical protein
MYIVLQFTPCIKLVIGDKDLSQVCRLKSLNVN